MIPGIPTVCSADLDELQQPGVYAIMASDDFSLGGGLLKVERDPPSEYVIQIFFPSKQNPNLKHSREPRWLKRRFRPGEGAGAIWHEAPHSRRA